MTEKENRCFCGRTNHKMGCLPTKCLKKCYHQGNPLENIDIRQATIVLTLTCDLCKKQLCNYCVGRHFYICKERLKCQSTYHQGNEHKNVQLCDFELIGSKLRCEKCRKISQNKGYIIKCQCSAHQGSHYNVMLTSVKIDGEKMGKRFRCQQCLVNLILPNQTEKKQVIIKYC